MGRHVVVEVSTVLNVENITYNYRSEEAGRSNSMRYARTLDTYHWRGHKWHMCSDEVHSSLGMRERNSLPNLGWHMCSTPASQISSYASLSSIWFENGSSPLSRKFSGYYVVYGVLQVCHASNLKQKPNERFQYSSEGSFWTEPYRTPSHLSDSQQHRAAD